MECRTPPCLPRGGLWPSSPQNVRSQGQYSTQERSPSLCEECVGPSSTRPGVHDLSSMTLIKGHRSRIRASTLPTALQPDSVGSGGESPFPGQVARLEIAPEASSERRGGAATARTSSKLFQQTSNPQRRLAGCCREPDAWRLCRACYRVGFGSNGCPVIRRLGLGVRNAVRLASRCLRVGCGGAVRGRWRGRELAPSPYFAPSAGRSSP